VEPSRGLSLRDRDRGHRAGRGSVEDGWIVGLAGADRCGAAGINLEDLRCELGAGAEAATLEVPLGVQNARTERRDLETKVEHDATTLASLAEDSLRHPVRRLLAPVAALAYRYRQDTGGRVVIVNRRGIAVIDTNPRGGGAKSFASRPETRAALRGNVAIGTRTSETLHTKLPYVAVPVAAVGRVEGAVRITYPTSAVDARIRRYWLALAAIAGVVLAIATAVGMRVAAFVASPLRRLERTAGAVGRGELSVRAAEDEGASEVRSLAAVFNETATKLEHVLRSVFGSRTSAEMFAASGQSDLAGALAEAERLAGLVDGLLSLARAGAEAAPARRVDLGMLLQERVDAWSAFAEESSVRLVAETDVAPVGAVASEERLRQAIDNLIENAVEVSPAHGAVTLRASFVAPWVEIQVRDEGPGMSPDELGRAFDRFWRARPGEGSGLGLAIVRRLIEADGGTVELRATLDGGLEALIRLPRAAG
jgi:signal transduction histidine kinase